MASQFGRNRIIEMLSQALEECQRRFVNPFQKLSLSKVHLAVQSLHTYQTYPL